MKDSIEIGASYEVIQSHKTDCGHCPPHANMGFIYAQLSIGKLTLLDTIEQSLFICRIYRRCNVTLCTSQSFILTEAIAK